MTQALKDILALIDRLDEAEEEEVQAALRLRAFRRFERLAESERKKFAAQGLTEEDVDRAVHEARYGKQMP